MKFFDTALSIEFQRCEGEDLAFLNEFNQNSKNAVLTHLKKLATKVDFSEGEELLFKLFLSLKEDIMRLEDKITQRASSLRLENEAKLCGIGFEGFKFSSPCLEKEGLYYGRLEIKRQIMSLFFKALSDNECEITQIKKEDKTLFDAFVVDTQRQNILKGKQ